MLKCILFLLLVSATAGLPVSAAAETPAAPAAQPEQAPAHRMKQYFFVLLRRGPDHGQSKAEAEKIQEQHMAHIRATAESGQLQIAGPFDDEDGDWRGILIYDVKTLDEAKALCAADPAVKAGRLVCDVRGWWAQQGATLK